MITPEQIDQKFTLREPVIFHGEQWLVQSLKYRVDMPISPDSLSTLLVDVTLTWLNDQRYTVTLSGTVDWVLECIYA